MVVQSSRSGYGPPSRAFFNFGLVPWAGFFKGRATGTSFGSLCHFRIILGSFWDDFRIILGGPWGVPGGSLGGSWGSPGVSGTGPAPVRHRAPKKCPKCVTVVKNRPGTPSKTPVPARRGTGFWDHPGSPYFSPLEPYSVPLLGKNMNSATLGPPIKTGTSGTLPM